MAEAVRSIDVTQFTCYRWRKEFGGLKTDQVELEKERRRKAVSDLALEKLIQAEAARGNFCPTCPLPCLHRACRAEVLDLGTVRLSRARAASFDPEKGAAGVHR